MTDTTQANDDHTADEAPLARMLDPKAFEAPVEKRETYGGDEHGIGQAADALKEERARREKPEAPIKKWKLDDDTPENISAKDAAKRLSFNRTAHRAADRAQRDGAQTGADAWKAGHITAQEMRAEAEPNVIEYQNKEKGERVNVREAARDLAEYRRTTAPAEAEALAEQRRLAAELGVLDLVQGDQSEAVEQPTHEPQPPEQPQPQQPDPAIIEARQRAAAEVQALQYLRSASQAEIVIGAQMQQLAQEHQREFQGVNDTADVMRLSPERQARWAAYADQMDKLVAQQRHASTERENVARRIQDAHQAQQAAAQQQQQAQFAAWKAHQDQIAAKDIPEINDEQHGHEFRKAAHETLRDYLGLTPETARNLDPTIARAMHYSGFQKLLADAARYRLGKQRAHEVSAKPLPPVQRPGVTQPKGARAAADVATQMERAFALPPGSERQKRAVASALAARRQAAQRSR